MGAHHRPGQARKRSGYRGRGRHRAKSQHTWMAPLTATTLSISLMAPVSAQASTLISIGATGSWDNAPITGLQEWPARNNFADDPVTATEVVEYPAALGFVGMSMEESVAAGTAALLRAIVSISGRKVITCESQGCLSVTRLLQQFAADPHTAPARAELIIVMIGNPATAGTGAAAQNAGEYEPFFRITFPGATPETQYETINVTREYDFFADRPDGDPSALAVLNNLVAFLVVHPFYGEVDMDDPDNLIKVVGNTTYVLVPTKELPILQSLYDAARAWQLLTGRTTLLEEVEALDARLRAIIDQGYDRSGYVPQGSLQPEEPAAPADRDGDPDDPSPDTSDEDAGAELPQDVGGEPTDSLEPEPDTITAGGTEDDLADLDDPTEDKDLSDPEDEDADGDLTAEDLADGPDEEASEPKHSEPTGASTPSGSAGSSVSPDTDADAGSADSESAGQTTSI